MSLQKPAILLALILLIMSAGTFGEDKNDPDPVGLGASGEVVSEFYWRGYDVTDGHPAFQPNFDLSHGSSGLWFNFWGNLPLSDRAQTRETDELDFTVGIDRSVNDALDITAGAIFYVFPRLEPDEDLTEELFVGFSLPSLPLTPTVIYFQDLSLGDGGYLQVGGTHSIHDLTLSLRSGFNFKQYTDKTGFTDLVLGAGYDISLGTGGYLTPSVNFAVVDDKERNPDSAELWFGIRFGWDR
jgi:hypothetical protein